MRIGIFGGEVAGHGGIDEVVASARRAADDGFSSYWMPQIFGPDALTSLAVVGREVPRIELGTAVVPTYPRHPMVLAAQALTTQAISGGRLVLGIGLSHQLVIEGMFGHSFEKPVRHMREYLSVLMPLIHEGTVSFPGETLSANGTLNITGATPFPVLIAALGPKMLELAGKVADGTVTWMTGPATLESHTVPAITKAADQAGRPPPRVCAGLPVCVTDDADGARERAARVFAVYDSLPSYKAMLDREGATGPADVAIVGDEATVTAAVRRLAEVGTTDFAAVEYGSVSTGDRERTRATYCVRCSEPVSEGPTSPLEALGALAAQEVEVTVALRHVEVYTVGGLLTMLWHGDPEVEHVVLACGGAMGGVLGPADGLYHDLGVRFGAQGIGLVRVGYRKPNDLGACVHDLVAVAELAARRGARRFVTMGHSFGGAVAVRAAITLGDDAAGVVTLATQSAGCEKAERLAGTPVLLFHGENDEILPPQASELVQMLTGGELVVFPGTGHLFTEVGDELRDRLGRWIPARFA